MCLCVSSRARVSEWVNLPTWSPTTLAGNIVISRPNPPKQLGRRWSLRSVGSRSGCSKVLDVNTAGGPRRTFVVPRLVSVWTRNLCYTLTSTRQLPSESPRLWQDGYTHWITAAALLPQCSVPSHRRWGGGGATAKLGYHSRIEFDAVLFPVVLKCEWFSVQPGDWESCGDGFLVGGSFLGAEIMFLIFFKGDHRKRAIINYPITYKLVCTV